MAEKRKAEATHRARFLSPAEERALEMQRAGGKGVRMGGGGRMWEGQQRRQQQDRAKVD